MTEQQGVASELEAALLERARKLAEEHVAHARDIREQIIQEEDARLRLREEREVLSAKALAERLYRRRIQGQELQLREQLERRRWQLVQSAMTKVQERLAALAEDDDEYLPVLQAWLAEAAACIPQGDLVAQLNQRDRQRLAAGWNDFAAEALGGRAVTLDTHTHGDAGGLHLRDKDNRVWVDNTVAGRLERLVEELHQAIAARLFPPSAAEVPHGQ